MKAISIYPVWAWAIMHGHKAVENRSWRTSHRGPLLVHATADSAAARDSDAAARAELWRLGVVVPLDVPIGAIVGCVNLDDVQYRHGPKMLFPHDPRLDDALATGPWCWLLSDSRAFDEPIRYSGKQGLWHCPWDVLPARLFDNA